MKISIVVPAHNEEKYIENCVKSLISQEEKPYEIIIIDNNSTDNTYEILKKYPQIKIHKEHIKGMILARNTAFNIASGDIIARCDADTICPKTWTKKIRENFEKEDIIALSGATDFYDYWFGNKNSFYTIMLNKFCKLLFQTNAIFGPNMAIKKSAWEKIKNEVCMNAKEVHEDIDLALHLKKYGKVGFDNDLITHISARRLKQNPISFFIEYPIRLFKMALFHKNKN